MSCLIYSDPIKIYQPSTLALFHSFASNPGRGLVAMNSSPRNQTPLRKKEMNQFKESQEIIVKLFSCLFAVIACQTTSTGDALFTQHPNVTMVMVLMIVIYFLVWLLGTMLEQRIGSFLIILTHIILVVGSVSSVLVLTVISSHIAWFTLVLWVGIFAVSSYCCYQGLYELIVSAVSDTIKKLIEIYKGQSTSLPI